MSRGDFKIYLIYLIVNNWKWLKYIVFSAIIFLILKAFYLLNF